MNSEFQEYISASELYKRFGIGHMNTKGRIDLLEERIEKLAPAIKPIQGKMDKVEYLYQLELIYEMLDPKNL